jgi:hypothetical protein
LRPAAAGSGGGFAAERAFDVGAQAVTTGFQERAGFVERRDALLDVAERLGHISVAGAIGRRPHRGEGLLSLLAGAGDCPGGLGELLNDRAELGDHLVD